MADQEGIAYCPARIDPLTNVQVADYSNVQYLEIEDSEAEPKEKAGESEPNEDDVNQGQSEPATPQILRSPGYSLVAPVIKPSNKEKKKAANPEPEEPVIVKGSPPLTAKRKKNARRKEKEKEKRNKNKANNAVTSMTPDVKPSEPSPPPAAEAGKKESSPQTEEDKPEDDASPPLQPADSQPIIAEIKEAEADTPMGPKIEANGNEESKELKQEASPSSDTTPTNESSNTAAAEQPQEQLTTESDPALPKEAESVQTPGEPSVETAPERTDDKALNEDTPQTTQGTEDAPGDDTKPPAPQIETPVEKPGDQGEPEGTNQVTVETAQGTEAPPSAESENAPVTETINGQEASETTPESAQALQTTESAEPAEPAAAESKEVAEDKQSSDSTEANTKVDPLPDEDASNPLEQPQEEVKTSQPTSHETAPSPVETNEANVEVDDKSNSAEDKSEADNSADKPEEPLVQVEPEIAPEHQEPETQVDEAEEKPQADSTPDAPKESPAQADLTPEQQESDTEVNNTEDKPQVDSTPTQGELPTEVGKTPEQQESDKQVNSTEDPKGPEPLTGEAAETGEKTDSETVAPADTPTDTTSVPGPQTNVKEQPETSEAGKTDEQQGNDDGQEVAPAGDLVVTPASQTEEAKDESTHETEAESAAESADEPANTAESGEVEKKPEVEQPEEHIAEITQPESAKEQSTTISEQSNDTVETDPQDTENKDTKDSVTEATISTSEEKHDIHPDNAPTDDKQTRDDITPQDDTQDKSHDSEPDTSAAVETNESSDDQDQGSEAKEPKETDELDESANTEAPTDTQDSNDAQGAVQGDIQDGTQEDVQSAKSNQEQPTESNEAATLPLENNEVLIDEKPVDDGADESPKKSEDNLGSEAELNGGNGDDGNDGEAVEKADSPTREDPAPAAGDQVDQNNGEMSEKVADGPVSAETDVEQPQPAGSEDISQVDTKHDDGKADDEQTKAVIEQADAQEPNVVTANQEPAAEGTASQTTEQHLEQNPTTNDGVPHTALEDEAETDIEPEKKSEEDTSVSNEEATPAPAENDVNGTAASADESTKVENGNVPGDVPVVESTEPSADDSVKPTDDEVKTVEPEQTAAPTVEEKAPESQPESKPEEGSSTPESSANTEKTVDTEDTAVVSTQESESADQEGSNNAEVKSQEQVPAEGQLSSEEQNPTGEGKADEDEQSDEKPAPADEQKLVEGQDPEEQKPAENTTLVETEAPADESGASGEEQAETKGEIAGDQEVVKDAAPVDNPSSEVQVPADEQVPVKEQEQQSSAGDPTPAQTIEHSGEDTSTDDPSASTVQEVHEDKGAPAEEHVITDDHAETDGHVATEENVPVIPIDSDDHGKDTISNQPAGQATEPENVSEESGTTEVPAPESHEKTTDEKSTEEPEGSEAQVDPPTELEAGEVNKEVAIDETQADEKQEATKSQEPTENPIVEEVVPAAELATPEPSASQADEGTDSPTQNTEGEVTTKDVSEENTPQDSETPKSDENPVSDTQALDTQAEAEAETETEKPVEDPADTTNAIPAASHEQTDILETSVDDASAEIPGDDAEQPAVEPPAEINEQESHGEASAEVTETNTQPAEDTPDKTAQVQEDPAEIPKESEEEPDTNDEHVAEVNEETPVEPTQEPSGESKPSDDQKQEENSQESSPKDATVGSTDEPAVEAGTQEPPAEVATEEIAQEAPAVESTPEPAQDPEASVATPAENTTVESAEEPIQEPSKEPEQQPAQEPTQEPDHVPAQEPSQEPEQAPVQDPVENLVDQSGETPTHEESSAPAEEIIQPPAENNEEKPVAKEPEAEKPASDDHGPEAPKEAADEQSNGTEPVTDVVQAVSGEPAANEQPVAGDAPENPVEEPAEEPAPNADKVETPGETHEQVQEQLKEECLEESQVESQEVSNEEPKAEPTEETEEEPKELPQEVPEDELKDETQQGIVEESQDEIHEESKEEAHETPEQTQEVPQEVLNDETHEEPQEKPLDEPKSVPGEEIQEVPEQPKEEPPEAPNEKPQEAPNEEPVEEPQEEAQEPKEEPKEIPEGAPQERTPELNEQSSGEVPEETHEEPKKEPREEPEPEIASKEVEQPAQEETKGETPADTVAPDQPQEETKESTDTIDTKDVEEPAITDQPEQPEEAPEEQTPKVVEEEVKVEKIQSDDESKDTVGPIPSEGMPARKASKGEDQSFSSLVGDTPAVLASDFGDTPELVSEHLISVDEKGDDLKEKPSTTEISEPVQLETSLDTNKSFQVLQEDISQPQDDIVEDTDLDRQVVEGDSNAIDNDHALVAGTDTLQGQDCQDTQDSASFHLEKAQGSPEAQEQVAIIQGNSKEDIEIHPVSDPAESANIAPPVDDMALPQDDSQDRDFKLAEDPDASIVEITKDDATPIETAKGESLPVEEPHAESVEEAETAPEPANLEYDQVGSEEQAILDAEVIPKAQDETGERAPDQTSGILEEVSHEAPVIEKVAVADTEILPADDVQATESIEPAEQTILEAEDQSTTFDIQETSKDVESVVGEEAEQPAVDPEDAPKEIPEEQESDRAEEPTELQDEEPQATQTDEIPSQLVEETPEMAHTSEQQHDLVEEQPSEPVAEEVPTQADTIEATDISEPISDTPEIPSVGYAEEPPAPEAELAQKSEPVPISVEDAPESVAEPLAGPNDDIQEVVESEDPVTSDLSEQPATIPLESNVQASLEDSPAIEQEPQVIVEDLKEEINLEEPVIEKSDEVHEPESIIGHNDSEVLDVTRPTQDESVAIEAEIASPDQGSDEHAAGLEVALDSVPQDIDIKDDEQPTPQPIPEIDEQIHTVENPVEDNVEHPVAEEPIVDVEKELDEEVDAAMPISEDVAVEISVEPVEKLALDEDSPDTTTPTLEREVHEDDEELISKNNYTENDEPVPIHDEIATATEVEPPIEQESPQDMEQSALESEPLSKEDSYEPDESDTTTHVIPSASDNLEVEPSVEIQPEEEAAIAESQPEQEPELDPEPEPAPQDNVHEEPQPETVPEAAPEVVVEPVCEISPEISPEPVEEHIDDVATSAVSQSVPDTTDVGDDTISTVQPEQVSTDIPEPQSSTDAHEPVVESIQEPIQDIAEESIKQMTDQSVDDPPAETVEEPTTTGKTDVVEESATIVEPASLQDPLQDPAISEEPVASKEIAPQEEPPVESGEYDIPEEPTAANLAVPVDHTVSDEPVPTDQIAIDSSLEPESIAVEKEIVGLENDQQDSTMPEESIPQEQAIHEDEPPIGTDVPAVLESVQTKSLDEKPDEVQVEPATEEQMIPQESQDQVTVKSQYEADIPLDKAVDEAEQPIAEVSSSPLDEGHDENAVESPIPIQDVSDEQVSTQPTADGVEQSVLEPIEESAQESDLEPTQELVQEPIPEPIEKVAQEIESSELPIISEDEPQEPQQADLTDAPSIEVTSAVEVETPALEPESTIIEQESFSGDTDPTPLVDDEDTTRAVVTVEQPEEVDAEETIGKTTDQQELMGDTPLQRDISILGAESAEETSHDDQAATIEKSQVIEDSESLSAKEPGSLAPQITDAADADDEFVIIEKSDVDTLDQATDKVEQHEPSDDEKPHTENLDNSTDEELISPQSALESLEEQVPHQAIALGESPVHEQDTTCEDQAPDEDPATHLEAQRLQKVDNEAIPDEAQALSEEASEDPAIPISQATHDQENLPQVSSVENSDTNPTEPMAPSPAQDSAPLDHEHDIHHLEKPKALDTIEAVNDLPTSMAVEEQSLDLQTEEDNHAGLVESGIIGATAVAVAGSAIAYEHLSDSENVQAASDHPLDAAEVPIEKPKKPEPVAVSDSEPEPAHVSEVSRSLDPSDVSIHTGPRDSKNLLSNEIISNGSLVQDAQEKRNLSRTATSESPEIVASNMPLSESFTMIEKDSIPQKSSKRALRPSLIHSGTQTEFDDDFGSRETETPYHSFNLTDLEPRSRTPGIVLPDLTDSKARALGRARSVRKQRRRTLRNSEETVAAAVIIYAAARELSPPPSTRLGSAQVENDVPEVLELAQGGAQKSDDVSSSGDVAGNQSVGQNDLSLPVADLVTDDEEKKSADERHHKHRHHHHHHHHHSSRPRDSKSSGEHLRHRSSRPESNPSIKTASDRSAPQTPKKQDSGFSVDSTRTSSSRRHRTPEEQAAHDKRKEERRASREVYDKSKETKGKDPEAPAGDRHSHHSSRRHSITQSEKSQSERRSEKSYSERPSERSFSDRYSQRTQSERFSSRGEASSASKKFFDVKNQESVLAPNFPTRSRTTSTSGTSPTLKDTSKSGTLKRSNTTKSHRESVDLSRTKSHRSHDESSKKRKVETKNGTEAEPSRPKSSPSKEDQRHPRREERQKAREAEAEAEAKKKTGFRAALKKIFVPGSSK